MGLQSHRWRSECDRQSLPWTAMILCKSSSSWQGPHIQSSRQAFCWLQHTWVWTSLTSSNSYGFEQIPVSMHSSSKSACILMQSSLIAFQNAVINAACLPNWNRYSFNSLQIHAAVLCCVVIHHALTASSPVNFMCNCQAILHCNVQYRFDRCKLQLLFLLTARYLYMVSSLNNSLTAIVNNDCKHNREIDTALLPPLFSKAQSRFLLISQVISSILILQSY